MNRYPVLVLCLLAAGSTTAAEKVLDKTFTVSPDGTLWVDADSASVRVSGVDTRQVVVRMRSTGSDQGLADTRLEAIQSGDDVRLTMRRSDSKRWFSWRSWSGDDRIEVTVPRRYMVNVRTGGGSIDLKDTIGTATLRTSGGDIDVKNLSGTVDLRTSGGGILAESIRGDVNADTSGGDVRLLQIDGKIKGSTSGGNVRVSLVGANREILASTSGGDIELSLPSTTTGTVEATTSGGEITSDLPVTSTSTREGRLEGSLNGGGPPIRARTSGGSIRLRVEN